MAGKEIIYSIVTTSPTFNYCQSNISPASFIQNTNASIIKAAINFQLQEESNSTHLISTESRVSREIIGKYERGEAVPSSEFAKRIADAFGVCLDLLSGEETHSKPDKKTVKRMQDIESLKDDDETHLFAIVDAFLRDAKTRHAYAQ